MGNSNTVRRFLTSALHGFHGFALIVGAMYLQGCQKEAPNAFLASEPTRSTFRTAEYDVRTLRIYERSLDVVWVVDNSGSMGPYQQAVATNAEIFMRNFRARHTPWQVALITTDENARPLLGFSSATNLNNGSVDPVNVFRNAVISAGTAGSASEKTIAPFRNAVRGAPNYLRPGVPLVLIIMTDAEEQTTNVTMPTFYNELLAMKGGDASLVKVFGIFAPTDWCTTGEGWPWTGSRYKQLIDLTGGITAKLCDPLGSTLDSLGRNIARETAPRIPLNVRPKLSTLRILHQGVELPGGEQENGGKWYYDYEVNAIFFYNLEFAPNDNESVEVIFRPEDGLPD